MPRHRHIDPFDLITRSHDLAKLLNFFMRLEERLTTAFPQAARMLPDSSAPSAKQVRGSTRRHHLHLALQSSACDSNLTCDLRWTVPPSWNYPVVRLGAFTATIGIVETKHRGAPRTLRSRSEYLKQLCSRNEAVNPQSDLFSKDGPPTLIPDGSLGGLIVAQFNPSDPTKPAFLGFWVPSSDLGSAFYIRSLDEIISMLRSRLSLARRPKKKTVERKPLRRKNDSDKKA